MKNMEPYGKFRILSGILLIASAITHVLQLFFVGFDWHDISAAIVGSFYGILGILLIVLKKNKPTTFICIIYPTIGGTLGIHRLIFIELAEHGFFNWFIVWHVAVDAVVVPSCAYYYIKIEEMDKNEIIAFLTNDILFITGVLLILQFISYGLTILPIIQIICGLIFILLGILLWTKSDNKNIATISIILILFGLILSIIGLFISPTPYLIVFIIIHIILLVNRSYLLKHV
jgi:hypothetical protein